MFSATAAPAFAQGPPSPPLQPNTSSLPAIETVVLVDESGSLSRDDVAQETEAARSIALSALSPESVITVVGFGSSDKEGQSAVDVVCPPTVLDTAQKRDIVAGCIGKLHSRKAAEGYNTDHLAALQQALGYLQDGSTNPKVVFLLTDGKLDAPDSMAYGPALGTPAQTEAARNAFALGLIPGVLADLRNVGAQVWPLGFGAADKTELSHFAEGQSCDPKVPAPAAQIIKNSAELSSAILTAFSSAACLGVESTNPTTLNPGSPVDLPVDIPPIASTAAIVVYKRDPRINVTYLDPNRQVAPNPSGEDSTFQLSGQGTGTESLRIIDPTPGRWTVHLTSVGGISPQQVAATVVYQGAVSAAISVTPPQPTAGAQVELQMQVRARKAAITDPAVLADLTFTADLTANGSTSTPITLTDPNKDGTYTGRLTVPTTASGELLFTGRVSGRGIGGDVRTLSTQVSPPETALQAQIQLDAGDGRATPGSSINGNVAVSNSSGAQHQLRLVIAQPSPGAEVTVTPPILETPASGTAKLPFTLHFDRATTLGTNQFALQVVTDSTPPVPLAERLLAIDVENPPGPFQRFWWVGALVIVGVISLLVVLYKSRRRKATIAAELAAKTAAERRKREAVQGLRVELFRGGVKINDLSPDNSDANVFWFTVHDGGKLTSQLVHAGTDTTAAYALRRHGDSLQITLPSSEERMVEPGTPITDVSTEMTLVIQDERADTARLSDLHHPKPTEETEPPHRFDSGPPNLIDGTRPQDPSGPQPETTIDTSRQ